MRNIFLALLFVLSFFLTVNPVFSQSNKNSPHCTNEKGGQQVPNFGPLSNKRDILNDPLLPEIVQHIQAKYNVHTVILHGSRARGTATLKSDYDIIGLQKSGEPKKYQEFFKGAYLDVSIYPQNFKEKDDAVFPLALFWQEAVILQQPHQEGEEFIKTLKEAFHQNQKDLSQKKMEKIRLLTINLSRSQENDVREHFYRRKFLTLALINYFPIRNQVYKGPRKSLEWLEKHDPLTYLAFNKALAPNANVAELHNLLVQVARPDLDNLALYGILNKPQIKEKYEFSKDSLLPDIVQHIQTTYGADTIILYGSRAQGTASSKSDYDIIALRGEGTPREDVRDLFKNIYIDLHLLSEDALNDKYLTSILSLVEGAVILCQKDHLGERFIQHIKSIYDRGFFAPDDIKKKVVDEIKMNLWKVDNSLVGHYYHHALLSSLLEHYFTLRNAYYIGSRESFRFLKNNDLPTYYTFEKALKPDASIESLEELVDHVIAPFENKKKVDALRHGKNNIEKSPFHPCAISPASSPKRPSIPSGSGPPA